MTIKNPAMMILINRKKYICKKFKVKMKNHFVIEEKFKPIEEGVKGFINQFDEVGERIYKGSRNELRQHKVGNFQLNIKRFKKPNIVNRMVYRRLRKSKAERSFLHAKMLQKKEIGTPSPVAFQENYSQLGIRESFYVSLHVDYDFTFRELIHQIDLPYREAALVAFTRFTFQLHENNIFFLDHSPGNTLIKQNSKGDYDFYLVDLNRMQFKKLSLTERIKNFERLTTNAELIEIMSAEYARLTQQDPVIINALMLDNALTFRQKFQRKKTLKHKFKFWKS